MRPFQFLDLLQPTHVASPAVEFRIEEGSSQLGCELLADDLRADAEHVHVVVLDTLVRRVRVVARRGANTGEFAGGDRRANARAADQDTTLGSARFDRLADLPRLVRIVDLR